MNYFVHHLSDVKTNQIGADTKIWQYCVIFENARLGNNCNVCANVLIENNVIIGDNVTIKSGVQLWDGVRIENDVFIGPNATFTNDIKPRSKIRPPEFLNTIVKNGASIGANATILPGIVIGAGAMIGAGSVVTRDVPPNAIVVGNPGVISGYTTSNPPTRKSNNNAISDINSIAEKSLIGGCRLYELPLIQDMRGNLSVAEYEQHIPFLVKRCFWVFGVPTREVRGEHAHKMLHQYLICLNGSINVVVDDGKNRQEISLNRPNLGLHIPPMVWGIQYKYSTDAVLLVLASDTYSSDDYIRNYDQFLQMI